MARGGRFPGLLELDGKLADGVAARIARYLPLGLPEATRALRRARGARRHASTSATFRVKGDLCDFPFHDARTAKRRRVPHRRAGRGRDVRLRAGVPAAARAGVASPWPALTERRGELVFDRAAMRDPQRAGAASAASS